MVHGKLIAAILTVLIVILSGCAQLLPPGFNTTGDPTSAVVTDMEETEEDLTILDEEELEEEIEEVEEMEEVVEEVVEEPEAEPEVEAAPADPADADLPRKTVVEGELVNFPNLQATDPDGDPISYTFTPPLDAKGTWQTEVGDIGEYKITVTASDGKNKVNQVVIIEVQSQNAAPEIEFESKITVKEGDTVTLDVTASDADGDEVTLTFSGWMTSTTKETGFDDAGFHEVEVTATDGTKITEETIQIIVENVNRPPVIEMLNDVTITEGDRIAVKPVGTDPDGDKVEYTFSSPLSADGFWRTTNDDVGKYQIEVTASDGHLTAVSEFTVIVESFNKAPVISIADLIKVEEGQTVTLSPEITDPENDELTIRYSGWMSTNSYQTVFEDAGSHLVTITVSDGINTAKKDVTVMVDDVNRAPTFGSGAFS